MIVVDGFIAGPNGEIDWLTFNWDDEIKHYRPPQLRTTTRLTPII